MARSGHVGMRELVDQNQRGVARESSVKIEFLNGAAAMCQAFARQQLQALEQLRGFRAAMCFDQTDDDLAALVLQLARRPEHGEGLAHACRCTEVHTQPAACGLGLKGLDFSEQNVGIGSSVGHDGKARMPRLYQSGVRTVLPAGTLQPHGSLWQQWPWEKIDDMLRSFPVYRIDALCP